MSILSNFTNSGRKEESPITVKNRINVVNLVSVDYSIELINVDINDPDPDPDQIQIRLKVSGKDFSFEANLNHAEDVTN